MKAGRRVRGSEETHNTFHQRSGARLPRECPKGKAVSERVGATGRRLEARSLSVSRARQSGQALRIREPDQSPGQARHGRALPKTHFQHSSKRSLVVAIRNSVPELGGGCSRECVSECVLGAEGFSRFWLLLCVCACLVLGRKKNGGERR